ncbi:7,8-dihydro-8-oxoguanine triphosphatase [Leucoagaricus sp. SymC.cos]|nr:7,8-dihydro-8-oxoguanine triphosphatase [Leucoagaricus sp. SymC.cos]
MSDKQNVPPGLSEKLQHHTSGGSDVEWLPPLPIKYYTVAHIVQNNKKRGFGQGKYNGFGGKVEPNETSLQAAKRELEEEAGIKAPLKHIGVLLFIVHGADKTFHIDIYYSEEYEGTVTESDEMRPEWFSLSDSDSNKEGLLPVPWDKMWDTDQCWIPLLRKGIPFRGRADFDKGEDGIFKPRRWWYGLLED